MSSKADSSERLVCAILAGQVAELRDRIDNAATVDLLWRTTDMLSRLSGLLVCQARRTAGGDGAFDAECAAAIEAETEISGLLDTLAFTQAQRQDCDRQLADCIVTALERLARMDAPMESAMSPEELATLYVTDDQRKVHDGIARRFNAGAVVDAAV